MSNPLATTPSSATSACEPIFISGPRRSRRTTKLLVIWHDHHTERTPVFFVTPGPRAHVMELFRAAHHNGNPRVFDRYLITTDRIDYLRGRSFPRLICDDWALYDERAMHTIMAARARIIAFSL